MTNERFSDFGRPVAPAGTRGGATGGDAGDISPGWRDRGDIPPVLPKNCSIFFLQIFPISTHTDCVFFSSKNNKYKSTSSPKKRIILREGNYFLPEIWLQIWLHVCADVQL